MRGLHRWGGGADIAPPAAGDEWRGWRRAAQRAALSLLLLPPALAAAPAWAEVTAVACAAAGAPAAPRIRVRVQGARNAEGNITVTLYGADPARYLSPGGKLARLRVPVRGGRAEACFAASGPGEFAVIAYHDENDDHDFNRTLLGLPKEGYGFSNNAEALVGPPSFNAVRFRVGEAGGDIAVTLRY